MTTAINDAGSTLPSESRRIENERKTAMALERMMENFPIFQNLTEKEKRSLSGMDHAVLAFKKGDMIIRQGDHFSSLFLLIRGTAVVTKTGYSTPIAELKPGSIFGEISFLTKKPRTSNVVADDNVLALKMDDDFLNRVSPEIRDKVKNYLIEVLATRLDLMNEALHKIAKYARVSAVM